MDKRLEAFKLVGEISRTLLITFNVILVTIVIAYVSNSTSEIAKIFEFMAWGMMVLIVILFVITIIVHKKFLDYLKE
jgi:Mn2+/Fe2+ NRAMP family transporter